MQKKQISSSISDDLRFQIYRIENLRQGNTKGGLAPHKPVLLLSLIDYLEKYNSQSNVFPIDENLFDIFKKNWNLLVTTDNVCDITNPIFYLQNDKVWTLSTNSPDEKANQKLTFPQMKKIAQIGYLESNLFKHLCDPPTREVIRAVILSRYFPITETKYYQENGIPTEIISADENLLEEPQLGYSIKNVSVRIFEGFIRDLRFRHQVLKAYNNTCAMSRYSVLGVPIIEACHIAQFALSGDNRIQNGIALCSNLHIAFDAGLIGLDQNYRIIVNSKKIQETLGHAYSLSSLKNKVILLPSEKRYHPSQQDLQYHREIHKL